MLCGYANIYCVWERLPFFCSTNVYSNCLYFHETRVLSTVPACPHFLDFLFGEVVSLLTINLNVNSKTKKQKEKERQGDGRPRRGGKKRRKGVSLCSLQSWLFPFGISLLSMHLQEQPTRLTYAGPSTQVETHMEFLVPCFRLQF